MQTPAFLLSHVADLYAVAASATYGSSHRLDPSSYAVLSAHGFVEWAGVGGGVWCELTPEGFDWLDRSGLAYLA